MCCVDIDVSVFVPGGTVFGIVLTCTLCWIAGCCFAALFVVFVVLVSKVLRACRKVGALKTAEDVLAEMNKRSKKLPFLWRDAVRTYLRVCVRACVRANVHTNVVFLYLSVLAMFLLHLLVRSFVRPCVRACVRACAYACSWLYVYTRHATTR